MVTVNPNANLKPAAPTPAAPAPQQEGVLADLDVLITDGVIERTVTPFKDGKYDGMRITMHTLKNPERNAVSREIPNEEAISLALSEQAPKIPTLIQAITCIELGEKKYQFITPESKVYLRTLLNGLAAVRIDMLYLEYLQMVDDLIKVIETGVKKN